MGLKLEQQREFYSAIIIFSSLVLSLFIGPLLYRLAVGWRAGAGTTLIFSETGVWLMTLFVLCVLPAFLHLLVAMSFGQRWGFRKISTAKIFLICLLVFSPLLILSGRSFVLTDSAGVRIARPLRWSPVLFSWSEIKTAEIDFEIGSTFNMLTLGHDVSKLPRYLLTAEDGTQVNVWNTQFVSASAGDLRQICLRLKENGVTTSVKLGTIGAGEFRRDLQVALIFVSSPDFCQ